MSREDHQVDSSTRARLSSVGREVTAVQVRLVGVDGDVDTGEPGEMWIRGDNIMTGYWNNPAATAEVFHDGWYRSGDIARQDEKGFYYIVDRARDMIISGGLNVYPAEVESVLSEHPDVAEVAVVGVPDPVWGEAVRAFVVIRPGASIDEGQVEAHCRDHLAGYKRPRVIQFVETLPRGATGKILKRKLVEHEWEGRARRVN